MTRYAARRDANEPTLVEAARKAGFKVFYLREIGDLLIQLGPLSEIWECKVNEKSHFTAAQLHMRQAGFKARTVRTVDDVLCAKKELMGAIRAIKEVTK